MAVVAWVASWLPWLLPKSSSQHPLTSTVGSTGLGLGLLWSKGAAFSCPQSLRFCSSVMPSGMTSCLSSGCGLKTTKVGDSLSYYLGSCSSLLAAHRPFLTLLGDKLHIPQSHCKLSDFVEPFATQKKKKNPTLIFKELHWVGRKRSSQASCFCLKVTDSNG